MRRFIAEEPVSRASIWSRRCALFGLALGAIAVAAIRLGAVDVVAGLAILGAGLLFGLVAMLLAGVAIAIIWRTGRRGSRIALSGLFLAAVLLAYPGWLAAKAVRLPLLADVTTDIADPPAFSRSAKALQARGGVVPTDPPPETRELQRRAYPDVKPIVVDLSPEDAYQAVQQAVTALGWKIVDQSPPGGRAGLAHVDAVSRTLILGLPDDIAIRITPLATQARIDVRFVSRYGRHDFGTGASRIRAFAAALQAEIEE
jgi:uncharacterized protein (DUF1499 family)